jgi:hypothetical protein
MGFLRRERVDLSSLEREGLSVIDKYSNENKLSLAGCD